MAKVTVEFSGRIEVSTQGWTDETKLAQIKKQAQNEVSRWQIFVKKGLKEPMPVNFIKMHVTEVIIDMGDN